MNKSKSQWWFQKIYYEVDHSIANEVKRNTAVSKDNPVGVGCGPGINLLQEK